VETPNYDTEGSDEKAIRTSAGAYTGTTRTNKKVVNREPAFKHTDTNFASSNPRPGTASHSD
jgi:hypothetical protein